MARPRFVTLTTDIGWAYAAQMKAVLARRAPRAIVVDVTHEVPPQSVREGAFLLAHIAPQFPPGTVHVAVVDPGVGGLRAPVAVATNDGSYFVGPDNGLLAPAAERLGVADCVRIDRSRVGTGGRPSRTFEGRDVFAPAAAYLASGRPFRRMGDPHELARFALPPPLIRANGVRGEILHVDAFGNAITSVPGDAVPPDTARLAVRVGRGPSLPIPFVRTYEEAGPDPLVALVSSFGLLELAEPGGSAARRLRLSVGDGVAFTWAPRPGRGRK